MSDLGDRIRKKLTEASKGEPETFGLVSMFMDMIDEAEKEDDADKSEIEKLRKRVRELDVLYEFGCRYVVDPPCAAEGAPWKIGLSGAGGKCTVFGATLEQATKFAVAKLDQWSEPIDRLPTEGSANK